MRARPPSLWLFGWHPGQGRWDGSRERWQDQLRTGSRYNDHNDQSSDHTASPRERRGRPSSPALIATALISDRADPGLSQLNSLTQVIKLLEEGRTHTAPWHCIGILVPTADTSVSSYTRSKKLPLCADSLLQKYRTSWIYNRSPLTWKRKLPLLHQFYSCPRWEHWGSRSSSTWRGSNLHLLDDVLISKLQNGISFHPSCWSWTWSQSYPCLLINNSLLLYLQARSGAGTRTEAISSKGNLLSEGLKLGSPLG